jgi:CRP-like cAMP-binding protein
MSHPFPAAFPQALHATATRIPFISGTRIFHRGSPAHAIFFIESGAVRLMRHGPAGEEVVLHDAHAGEFVAEASLGSARYHCDAVATQPGTVLKVPADTLRLLIDTDPKFAREWVALLSRQLRAARTRVERLSLKSAEERIRHLLLSEGRGPQCEVALDGNLKDLARTLGITHEVLYRTLARMERDGTIERGDALLRLRK